MGNECNQAQEALFWSGKGDLCVCALLFISSLKTSLLTDSTSTSARMTVSSQLKTFRILWIVEVGEKQFIIKIPVSGECLGTKSIFSHKTCYSSNTNFVVHDEIRNQIL